MTEALFYLVSSFWLGALHAATPGHGKTIAAAYIVGTRGRPADAVALGIFATLAHVAGIVAVALLASLGAAWSEPARIEAYLSLATALLVVGIGLWMLVTQGHALARRPASVGDRALGIPRATSTRGITRITKATSTRITIATSTTLTSTTIVPTTATTTDGTTATVRRSRPTPRLV